jgi:hypothetical protein
MLPTMEDVRSIGDFVPVYKWELTFMEGPLVSPDIQALNFHCVSSSLPRKIPGGSAVSIRGHQKKFSTISTYDMISLQFVETVDNLITAFLHDLHEASWETNTGLALPQANIEFTVRLTSMDREGNGRWAYQLYGCWLEAYDPGGPFTDSPDIFRPSMTLSYDYFEENVPNLL